jgi:hypothetical protein
MSATVYLYHAESGGGQGGGQKNDPDFPLVYA